MDDLEIQFVGSNKIKSCLSILYKLSFRNQQKRAQHLLSDREQSLAGPRNYRNAFTRLKLPSYLRELLLDFLVVQTNSMRFCSRRSFLCFSLTFQAFQQVPKTCERNLEYHQESFEWRKNATVPISQTIMFT